MPVGAVGGDLVEELVEELVGEGLAPCRSSRSVHAAIAFVALSLLVMACSSGRKPTPPTRPDKPPAVDEPEPERSVAPAPKPPARRRPPTRAEIESRSFPNTLPLPVDGAERSDLANSFNAPRSGGRRHRAIDIMAPRDTPVRSATDGFVSHRAVMRLGGNTISIIGPAGYRHYYAHLERWAEVREGGWVAAGDVIGYVGNTGNARGGPTHLHYAIYRKDGEAVDPYPLLRRGPGSFE